MPGLFPDVVLHGIQCGITDGVQTGAGQAGPLGRGQIRRLTPCPGATIDLRALADPRTPARPTGQAVPGACAARATSRRYW